MERGVSSPFALRCLLVQPTGIGAVIASCRRRYDLTHEFATRVINFALPEHPPQIQSSLQPGARSGPGTVASLEELGWKSLQERSKSGSPWRKSAVPPALSRWASILSQEWIPGLDSQRPYGTKTGAGFRTASARQG